jgi:hypothetical protein
MSMYIHSLVFERDMRGTKGLYHTNAHKLAYNSIHLLSALIGRM